MALRLTAIVSLIHQNADDIEVRDKMVYLLKHETPVVREMTADYLAWHETIRELPRVKEFRNSKDDVFALASLVAAQDAIERRHRKFVGDFTAPPCKTMVPPRAELATCPRSIFLVNANCYHKNHIFCQP